MSKYINFKTSAGFTLIEILVVATITGVITTFMLLNFQRTRLDLTRSANLLISDIRSAQTKTNASSKYDSGSGLTIRCGYGVRYKTNTSYSVYIGPDAATNNCSSLNRNFDGSDTDVNTRFFSDQEIEFKGSFSDIFFEPPYPTTFINNSSASASIIITIGKKGAGCPQNCRNISVSTSGIVE